MKANELMPGDLVKITEPDDFHGYIGEVRIINDITGYITVAIPFMHTTDVLCDDLEPIPLTEEILEKNGFKKWTWWKHHKDDTVTYAIGEGLHVEIEERMINGKNEKIFNLVDNCNDSGDYGYESNYICDVNYVHELQHALKLCKIEKEIEL